MNSFITLNRMIIWNCLIFSLILLKAMNPSRKTLLKNGTFSASTGVNNCNLSYPVG